MANSYLSTQSTQWPTTGAGLSTAVQLCDGLYSLETAVRLCMINRHYDDSKKLAKLNVLLEKLNKFFSGYAEKGGKHTLALTPSKLRTTINGHIAALQKPATLL